VRLAHICPPGLLTDVIDDEEDYHLVLTGLVLRNEQYRSFYAERSHRGDLVILDNDAYENTGKSTPIEELVSAISYIDPTVAVLPDLRGASWDYNFKLAEAAALMLSAAYPTLQLMGVAHGATLERYLASALMLASLPGVSWIGVYEETWDDFRIPRQDMVRLLSPINAKIHLLGLTEDMRDVKDAFVRQRVEGSDSCKLIRWGLHGSNIRPTDSFVPEYPGRGTDYFDRGPDDPDWVAYHSCVRGNIRRWREHLRTVDEPLRLVDDGSPAA
jgi:hypothetical protein